MTIARPSGKGESLDFAHTLVDMGVPVFTARLDAEGAPHRPSWEKLPASHTEVNKWKPGMALCAHTGVKFDVLDVDPRHGGWESYQSLRATLGRDPDFYAAVKTRSGGLHMYVPPLGLGTHHPATKRLPGIDLQGKGAMVFIPPTSRLDGIYTLSQESLQDLEGAVRDDGLRAYLTQGEAAGVETSGRRPTEELRLALLTAPDGQQRDALLAYTAELEYRYEREDVRHILLSLLPVLRSYDSKRPWNERNILGGLHRPGIIVPDHPDASDLDFSEQEESGLSREQRTENRKALIRETARMYARDRLAAASPVVDLAGFGISLTEDMDRPRPAIRWAVENLATAGSQVTLPSSRKTGKTTFLLNLCMAAGNGTPFLDRFECSMDGNVGYINAEMLRADILGYCDRLGRGIWTDRVRMLHCREDGIRLNLMNDAVCSRLVDWCVSLEVEWLVADPWKNFLGWSSVGMNDNDAVLALSDRFRSIATEACLQLVMIPMHTTQTAAEDGQERGKGAGELEDGADWLWRYERIGDMSEPRKLSSEGRGPGVEPMVVLWDEGTGLLSCDSRMTSGDVRRSSGASRALESLELLLINSPSSVTRVKSLELQSAMTGAKGDKLSAIRAAVSAGLIVEDDEGRGRPTWYSLPKLLPGMVGID